MLEVTVDVLRENLSIQKQLLNTYRRYDPASLQKMLPKTYQDIPVTMNPKEHLYPDLERWENESSPDDEDRQEEDQKHTTSFGLKVRSKSEVVIAELLHAARIPFKYELLLFLKDKKGRTIKYKPDFTIMTPFGKRYIGDIWA